MAMLTIDTKFFESVDEEGSAVTSSFNENSYPQLTCMSQLMVDTSEECQEPETNQSPIASDSGCASEHSSHGEELPIIEEAPKKRRGGWPKGKKRKYYTTDSQPPKAPSTGYVIFMSERRQQIKKSNPDIAFYEVTKILGNEWSCLSPLEKKVYLHRADEDKKRYRDELKIYRQAVQVASKVNAPEEPCDQSISASLLEEEDSSDLHCRLCDVYFITKHNKQEHLYGRQHLERIKGNVEAKSKDTGLCNGKTLQREKFGSSQTADATQQTILNSLKPVPDITSAIELVMTMNHDRESEITHLHQNIDLLQQNQSELLKDVRKWHEHRKKYQQDLATLKNSTNEFSVLLENLRNVPKLFGVINF